jgi:uncharacterized protein (DUF433 family)
VPYDPATETDPLIREHIVRDPVTWKAVFRSHGYPVGAILLNLLGSNYDWDLVRQSFPELSRADLEAAARFWELHSDEIRPYLD